MNVTDSPTEREAHKLIGQLAVCGRSWGAPDSGWWYCTKGRGHEGDCACAGIPKRPDQKYWEEQSAVQLAHQKDWEVVRKAWDKKHGSPPPTPKD